VRRAIREHLRDFVAVAVLLLLGLVITGLILSQQQQPYPSWVPFLGDDRFELRAEFETAQAVTPGQGQTVNIAGVKAGDISEVELEDGRAVVTMLVDQKYAPLINTDATMLLRPRTGLQDMSVEVDVGDSGEPVSEGEVIPVSQTEPNVQPDQILASLDGDTRAYLQLLIQGGSEGLGSRAKGIELSAGLRRFEPLGRYLAQIGDALVERRRNIASVITSLRELGLELGRTDVRLSDWVSSQNSAIGAFADQEASLRQTLAEFPSALRETRTALRSGNRLALELGPASRALIPAARAFAPAQRSLQGFFTSTTGPIRDQIRPFTTQVQPTVEHVKQAAEPLAATTTGLARSVADLNRLFNGLSYNPPGPVEGYLFWIAWLNHNQNNAFMTQDSEGPLLRGSVLQACGTAVNAEAFALARPFIRTLQQVTNVTPAAEICPLDPTAPPIITPPIVPPIRP
jgi:phospholipid/cholesterol/gamma-HCH transport system substrate-binding protein